MLIYLLNSPVFYIVIALLTLATLLIVHLERLHLAHSSAAIEIPNPIYPVLENAEHRNCRLTFCQSNDYNELGPILECNIHNVGKEWVHITYPINSEDDVHKIISIDKIATVEIMDEDIAS